MAHARPIPQLPWGVVIPEGDCDVGPADGYAQSAEGYAQFRKNLLEDGFTVMQFSMYSRHCASIENAEVNVKRMGDLVPAAGEVRFLTITDRQFGRIAVQIGKKHQKTPSPHDCHFAQLQTAPPSLENFLQNLSILESFLCAANIFQLYA